ncbi:MAG: alpha/beta fold hydrolase [Luteibacter sp.]
MVARLQQLIVIVWFAMAIAWGAWWLPGAPALAVTGIAALALAHAAVLAVEFTTSRWISAGDARPRASALQFAAAWCSEAVLALRVFAWAQPFRSRAVPDHLPQRPRQGVVLVHGFLCNRGFWNPWLRELRRDDRAFVAVDLEPPLGSIDAYVHAIDDAVAKVSDATGQPPLLVCHSMGGLAARAWLLQGGAGRVPRIVTLGTPHGGTWLARFGRAPNGRQMRIGGEWLQRLANKPGDAERTEFTCWYSDCDNVVFPISTATLPGADNLLAAGLGHVAIAFDLRVRRETLALLKPD